MRPCDTSYLLRQFVGVGYDKYLIFLTIFNIWYHWLGLTWRWEQTATWPLSYKSRLLYAGPDSPESVWLGFVLKFYTLLSVRELGSLYSHLLLPDPVRKATSSLSSLTYIVSTESNQQSFCKVCLWGGCVLRTGAGGEQPVTEVSWSDHWKIQTKIDFYRAFTDLTTILR